jgi:hypothetical protein
LPYADDISIRSCRTEEAAEIYSQLKSKAKETGLEINIQKTKKLTQARARGNRRTVELEDDIETVESFIYLGVTLNTDGTEEPEIQRRIVKGNKAYFSLDHVFRSNNTHWRSKIRVYKTIIRPIVCYGCETWVMTEETKRKLEVFERKVLRKIFGPINENGIWRSRYNHELYQLFKETPVSESVKLQRLRWAGCSKNGDRKIAEKSP